MQKKNNKTKEKVAAENKKPPNQTTPKEQESINEITDEVEEKMLKGEEHIDPNLQPQKDITESQEVTNPPPKEKAQPKRQLQVKPRESYLKEKMSKLNCNEKLLTSIQKGLGEQMENIKEENVLITEVAIDLNKYLPKEDESKINKTTEEDYALKKKHKAIKDLKDEQNILKRNLETLKENENLLKNEGYIDLSQSQKIGTLSKYDKSMKEKQIKEIQTKKTGIIDRISQIDLKIKELLAEEKQSSRKEKLKDFIENFERDKEIAETRAKKYLKESKERSQRMANDINQIVEKRKKEIDDKSKEAEQQKEELIKKLKEQEKAIELKRSKDTEQKVLQFKPYIHEKPEKKASTYLFSKKYQDFQNKEKKNFQKETNKRKEMMKSIPLEQIKEFASSFDENKAKYNADVEERKKKMHEEWKERKNLLPSYVSPAVDKVEEDKNSKISEEAKREKIEALIKMKKSYSSQVQEERQPIISEKLKKERMDKINALVNPKSVQTKATKYDHKKKRVLLKKRDPTKPSKYKWKLKLEEDPKDKLNNSVELYVKKPKSIRFASASGNKKRVIPEKKIDYLKEMVASREMRQRAQSSGNSEENERQTDPHKWDRAINNKNGNIIENMNYVKNKAEDLEKQAVMKEKILRLNGGIESNPEMGKQVSNLIIDSIEAKLSILNNMYKQK